MAKKEFEQTTRDSGEHGDANRDPLSGTPGAHPVGAGIGAAGGATAGAAAGALGGPVGVVAGAIIGGLVCGLTGKGVAELIDPTDEHAYWQQEYPNRKYARKDRPYDSVAPEYQYGWESSAREFSSKREQPRHFEDVEDGLAREWESHRTASDPVWSGICDATKDAYERTHKSLTSARRRH